MAVNEVFFCLCGGSDWLRLRRHGGWDEWRTDNGYGGQRAGVTSDDDER